MRNALEQLRDFGSDFALLLACQRTGDTNVDVGHKRLFNLVFRNRGEINLTARVARECVRTPLRTYSRSAAAFAYYNGCNDNYHKA